MIIYKQSDSNLFTSSPGVFPVYGWELILVIDQNLLDISAPNWLDFLAGDKMIRFQLA